MMNVPGSEAAEYLQKRGINPSVASDLGVEIMTKDSCPPEIFQERLGFDRWDGVKLADLLREVIFVPHKNAKGEIESWSARMFPTLRDSDGKETKFLVTKGKNFPFIPQATWDVAGNPSHPLSITEGAFKAVAILQAGGFPIGISGVWMATTKDDFGTHLHPVLAEQFQLRGRLIPLLFDGDHAKNLSVRQALIRTAIVFHKHGAEIVVVRWPLDEGKGIDDYLAGKAGSSVPIPALFAEMCKAGALLPEILRYLDLEVTEMELIYSQLKGTPLDQFCRLVAKPLNVRASLLLEEVQMNRYRFIAEEKTNPVPNVTPRPLIVILEEIRGILKKYVTFSLPEEHSTVIALWILHTWFFAAFDFTPYLYAHSPSWRSGKTRLFETISLVCHAPEVTSGASAAALIRANRETNPPTYEIDELDTVFSGKPNKEDSQSIRQFLNAGYERGATFHKCVGQGTDIVVQRFPAFAPKALASIRICLHGTIIDRSISIEMERQQKGRKAAKLRKREARAEVAGLRDELKVLAADEALIEELRQARPTMPDELNDRQQDVCEPLLAIAHLAAGEWPEKARDALIKLIGEQDEEQDVSIRLLADIRRIFYKTGEDKLPTQILLEELVKIADDALWPDWFEKALKDGRIKSAASKLAWALKPHKIKPTTVWIGEGEEAKACKGYHRGDFKKAWDRYLPDFPSPSPDSKHKDVRNSSKAQTENDLEKKEKRKVDPNPNVMASDDKSLTEKGVTQNPNDLTFENGDPRKENLAEPQNPETETKIPDNVPFCDLTLEQRVRKILEIFPDATPVPDEPPNPMLDPPDNSPEPDPELPF
jgi:hypothetical protein